MSRRKKGKRKADRLVGSPHAGAAPEANRALPRWTLAAVIVLLTVAAYAPVLWAGFIWDDDDYVTKNLTLRDTSGLQRIWFDRLATPQYYPLVYTTFWVEYRLWGLHPLGYHVVNVLLHAANALLLWSVLRRLAMPGAFWAAALFAVHPVEVESVAWVTERKNVLSALCYLASFRCFLEFWQPEEDYPRTTGRWRFYACTLLLFAGALLSKTVTCSLPAAFLLVRWWKRGRITVYDVAVTVPLFVLGLALALNTAAQEREIVGAQGHEWDFSPIDRVLIAGRALWFYAGKLIWPVQLTFIYPRWQIDAGTWWQYLFPAAAVALLAVLWLRRDRLGRGPLTTVLFFAGTLVPALGFFDVYPMRFSFVADHFQYLASIGLLALAAAGWERFRSQLPAAQRQRTYLAGAAIVLVLAAMSWQQSRAYENLDTIWNDTLAKNPNCWLALNSRARLHEEASRLDLALADVSKAIELKNDNWEAYFLRGRIYKELNQPQRALDDIDKSIKWYPGNPDAYYLRAQIYYQQKNFRPAIDDYTRAIEWNLKRNPIDNPTEKDAEYHNNRGLAWQELGELEKSLDDLNYAVKLAPNSASAFYNRGNTHYKLNQRDKAIQDFSKAIELNPKYWEAFDNRGAVHFLMGHFPQAEDDFNRAIAIKPGAGGIFIHRALLRYDQKRFAEACSDLQRGRDLGSQVNEDVVRRLNKACAPP